MCVLYANVCVSYIYIYTYSYFSFIESFLSFPLCLSLSLSTSHFFLFVCSIYLPPLSPWLSFAFSFPSLSYTLNRTITLLSLSSSSYPRFSNTYSSIYLLCHFIPIVILGYTGSGWRLTSPEILIGFLFAVVDENPLVATLTTTTTARRLWRLHSI